MWEPAAAYGTATWTLTGESHVTRWGLWAPAPPWLSSPKENGFLEMRRPLSLPSALHYLLHNYHCHVRLVRELGHTVPTHPPGVVK